MSPALDGYRFERRLRGSVVAEVWTAVRERDGQKVIAKVFAIERRPALELRVRHEFELIRALDVPGVVRALTCERSGPHLFLLLEAHHGVDLASYAAGRPLSFDRFFTIACQLTATLARVHEQRVIHRDIKPTNVLVGENGDDVMLADFGISVLLESERGLIHDPAVLQGTLPYVSPEQTGRTGREVDFRSDLYSLGVTFYELLIGERPFRADTPLELIHAHLARHPIAPRRLRPDIPVPLSRVITKLLEKAPERRYQSARGLLDDLERLRDAWAEGSLASFEIGSTDVPLSLQFPHQLYGREAARASLDEALREAVDGPPSVTFVIGEPGVGKSALLDELAARAVALGGRLIRGGFERGREEPLFGLSLALASLADQLLTEAPDELARWQRELRAELGPLAMVVGELAPRFDALLGARTHELSQAQTDAARNRVRQACVRVLELAADPHAPLLLALDDMQWADAETIAVLEALAASSRRGLALVLAARPDAMHEHAPLADLAARLGRREQNQTSGQGPIRIELAPLSRDELAQWLADTLSHPRDEGLTALAELIDRKTGGNPFLVRQFLTRLYERELLRRATRDRSTDASSHWTWELAAIERAGLPTDAAEMIASRLASFEPRTRELVQVAALLGNELQLELLVRTLGRDEVAPALLELVDAGVLTPAGVDEDADFVFVHSRVRELARAQLPAAERRRWHRRIGEQMLAWIDDDGAAASSFDVVEHLDRGWCLWPGDAGDEPPRDEPTLDDAQREQLLALNLRAGRRALATGLAEAARVFLDIAARLVADCPPDPSGRVHPSYVEIHRELAAAESLTHAPEAADRRLAELLAMPLDPLTRAEVALVRSRTAMAAARMELAVAVTLEAVAALGVEMPQRATAVHVAQLLPRLLWMVRPAGIARVRELEPMHDRRIELAMDLLNTTGPSAFIVSRETFVVFAATQAELILAHGYHVATPVVFGQIALVLANALGRRRPAIELHRMCAELAAGGPFAHRVEINGLFLRAWVDPLLELVDPAEHAAELAVMQGDINSAAIAKSNGICYALYGGMHLRAVEDRVAARWRWIEQWGVQTSAPGGLEVARVCQRLREGPALRPGERVVLGLVTANDPGRVEHDFAMLDALLAVVFGQWADVYALLDPRVEGIARLLRGTWYVGPSRLWWGLACAELARDSRGARHRSLRRKLATAATALADWRAGGGNFGHMADILEAELAVLDGDLPRASRLYERARDQAVAQQHHALAGLASERHARAWATAGHRRLALGPMLDAHERYATWGAFAKLQAIEREWPELARVLASHPAGHAGTASGARLVELDDDDERSTGSSSTANQMLDVTSLMQAAQTVAADLRVHEVISRVMAIALENAGAVRAVLLLTGDGEVSLAAEASVDAVEVFLDDPPPLAEIGERVPAALLHYVQRVAEPIVLDAVDKDPRFATDPYFRTLAAEGEGISVLCVPMIKRGRVLGLLYFENPLGAAVFGSARVELIQLLAGHAASALENARLYENLRDSEIRWRSLVDQLPDHVILVGRNGRLEYVNAAARPRQINAFSFNAPREFVHGQDAHLVEAAVARALQSGAREQLEVQVELSGSAQRWFSIRVAPIAIEGTIDRAIVVATDIDARKSAETERDQLELRLRQQQRLDSIGTLASGVAHEINNPIQGIMNYAELIVGAEPGDEMIGEFAREITIETQRVATIVRQLLEFSRQELTESLERTSVVELVEGTVSLIRALLRRDQIKLELELPEDLPKVECRRQQIHQVLMNLVTNARDALNERWRGYDERKRIHIGAEAFMRDGAQWLRISVSDEAGGVPVELVSRIFDPFFTTKGRDLGTGLGLAVSHGIVSEHAGVLALDNRPGEGASFRIELPCQAPARTDG